MRLALSLPNIQEWIIIAVVAVLLFGRRLPEVIAQVLHGIRVARQHLDELRRSSGFDEDLREAQRAISQTREAVRREARELTAPLPTIQGAKDAVKRELIGVGDELEESIRRTPPPTTADQDEAVRRDPAAPDIDGTESDPERRDPDAGAVRGPDPEPLDRDR